MVMCTLVTGSVDRGLDLVRSRNPRGRAPSTLEVGDWTREMDMVSMRIKSSEK